MQERKQHNFIMENREKVILSGVTEIISFNDSEIDLFTELGELKMKGDKLEIINANKEVGDMQIIGRIDAVWYGNDKYRSPDNFITRLFK
ncbi:MAG: sporulation protein YabP [Eubacterium sp.]|jgi:sporulation protein YabP|nr:sporulation protein YabP [Eubacterium sp.]